MKLRFVLWLQRRLVNPIMRAAAQRGLSPSHALLETMGRRSGRPRTTPVGNGLRDGQFWIVAEHGRRAQYVQNLLADPRVRVRLPGRSGGWRRGTAVVLDDDDPVQRLRWLGGSNSRVVKLVGTDLLTVRVDLDAEA